MTTKTYVHVGVDVGGTNTDAVVLSKGAILSYSKVPTSKDVTTGICNAISEALRKCTDSDGLSLQELEVLRVHIGTTHFVNAVSEKQHLAPVAVIRICAPASVALPPFSDFPEDLKNVMGGIAFLIRGGHYFDGTREISPLYKEEVERTINSIESTGLRNIVVSGLFSPVNNEHEMQVGKMIQELYPDASFTLSHNIAQLDMLLRENSAIINESLKPLAHKTIDAIRQALDKLNLHCPFYLTQNDGTLISAEKAKEMPVLTFASGPTNSMRGAAYLSGMKNGVVVDIGGTTTDAGMLINGFPRQSSTKVKICGVKTNFQMPDTVTIPLGGGSVVRFIENEKEHKVTVGPNSVGYKIHKDSIVFGGHTLTTTDIAVAADIADVGPFQDQLTAHYLPETLVKAAMDKIRKMLEDLMDSVKTSKEEVPVILVGGGTILVCENWKPAGIEKLVRPPHYQVANAVGAALSQVSGSVDTIENLSRNSREEAIKKAKKQAVDVAIKEGADPKTIEIISLADVPLTYVPGNVTRIMVKAVGDLLFESESSGAVWHHNQEELLSVHDSADHVEEEIGYNEDVFGSPHAHELEIAQDESPKIDPKTGEWLLTIYDIKVLEIGTGIMGCGGGGNPLLGTLMATELLKQGRQIRVMNPDRFCRIFKPDDLMLPIGFMGAPTVWSEMLFSNIDSRGVIQAIEDIYTYDNYKNCEIENKDCYDILTNGDVTYIENYQPQDTKMYNSENSGNRVVALCPFDSGGCNGMVALFEGAESDISVIDCDLMGRAFPELQMITSAMNGLPNYPACVGNVHDQRFVGLKAKSAKHLEDKFREICIDFGCMAGLAMSPLAVKDIPGNVVAHSLSRAWRLGHAILDARKQKTSPIDAILNFAGGLLLLRGKICDVDRKTEGGFAKGQIIVQGFGDKLDHEYLIKFQNENLVVKCLVSDKTLACVPDLITLVDNETGEPIPTDEVRYGLRVAVVALPAPPILTTPQALEVVGPKAFGYESEIYVPVGHYVEHDPIPPP